jgi:hypothetical protein
MQKYIRLTKHGRVIVCAFLGSPGGRRSKQNLRFDESDCGRSREVRQVLRHSCLLKQTLILHRQLPPQLRMRTLPGLVARFAEQIVPSVPKLQLRSQSPLCHGVQQTGFWPRCHNDVRRFYRGSGRVNPVETVVKTAPSELPMGQFFYS